MINHDSLWVSIQCTQCKKSHALGWEMEADDMTYWVQAAINGTARSDIGKYTHVKVVDVNRIVGVCALCQ